MKGEDRGERGRGEKKTFTIIICMAIIYLQTSLSLLYNSRMTKLLTSLVYHVLLHEYIII